MGLLWKWLYYIKSKMIFMGIIGGFDYKLITLSWLYVGTLG